MKPDDNERDRALRLGTSSVHAGVNIAMRRFREPGECCVPLPERTKERDFPLRGPVAELAARGLKV